MDRRAPYGALCADPLRAMTRRASDISRLADWMRRHQFAALFALTFAITWGLGFSYDALLNVEAFLMAPLAFAATAVIGLRDMRAFNATFRRAAAALVGADCMWNRLPIEHLAVYQELPPGNYPFG